MKHPSTASKPRQGILRLLRYLRTNGLNSTHEVFEACVFLQRCELPNPVPGHGDKGFADYELHDPPVVILRSLRHVSGRFLKLVLLQLVAIPFPQIGT